MKLPNVHLAVVEQQKVVNYLLNAAHPDNGGKAKFFFGLGFSADEWEVLADLLIEGARLGEVVEFEQSAHGHK